MDSWGPKGQACLPDAAPLIYSDGQHTYICVQGPSGPEYIQRPHSPAPPGTVGVCSLPSPSSYMAPASGLVSETTTVCSTGCASEFASCGRSEPADGEEAASDGRQFNSGKRRLDGTTVSSNASRHCHIEEEDSCARALKHSRSFGLTHVMPFSSVSFHGVLCLAAGPLQSVYLVGGSGRVSTLLNRVVRSRDSFHDDPWCRLHGCTAVASLVQQVSSTFACLYGPPDYSALFFTL